MPRRPRLILAAAAAALALWGLLVLRARRNESAAPVLASGPSAVASASIADESPPPATAAPGSGVIAPPPLLESPDARFRRQVAELSAEFERLRAGPDDIERLRASAELENEYAHLLEQTPELAAMLVREMPPGFVDTHFGVLALLRWAATERMAAAEWMAARPAATGPAAEALARGWLAQDEASLAEHLASLPPIAWRGGIAYVAAEDAFLAKRPETVLAMLGYVDRDDARGRQLAEWNATAWAVQDAETAAAWAAREPDAERRRTLLAAVAVGEANRDPEAAARRLFRDVGAGPASEDAVEAIARLWTRRDAEAAARWAASLPEGPLRERAEAGLLEVASPE
jgi:hypothetical protein